MISARSCGRSRTLACCLLVVLCAVPMRIAPLRAQRAGPDLSEAEVETIREAAMLPAERVLAYSKIVETRIDRIQRVIADARAQGRAEDIHQNMEEVTGVVNELEDNLDDYRSGHKDLRKVLPKLIASTDRWSSILRQPPDQDKYKVTRQLALEAVADLKDDAQKLLPEQLAYFKEHPPSKEPPPTQYEVPR